jgi:hypothetical protein
MKTAIQIAKVHELTSVRTQGFAKNSSRLTRFWVRITKGVGTGSCKPEFYSSMSQKQLEQRAQEDMAIAKVMGF